ncbi:glycosyltransferase family 2 protein [Ekhidna sp.]|uniref:glycosyltransferase family 2 protein n=1 Tax=Ekhidna sp. TaxID=2608089 RepID=UPI003B513BAF
MEQSKTKIGICICTYLRPKMLKELLQSLTYLKEPKDTETIILIIDNDRNKTAEPVLKEGKIGLSSFYFSEKSNGLDIVRNRALKEAMNLNCDYLAFIDDDETADSDWIINLYETAQNYHAEIVAGYVKYLLPKNTPEWMQLPGFYNKEPRVTGSERKIIGAGNVLINLKRIAYYDVWFRSEFRFSGGEDTFFFQELINKGCKAVHCQEAITFEEVPQSRATISWLYERSFMFGYVKAQRYFLSKKPLVANLSLIQLVVSIFSKSIFSSLFWPFYNLPMRVRTKREWHRLKGIVFAMTGGSLTEYKNVHGS